MPEIFVGRGNDGQIKYLDEVPFGLACNCTCLVCDGPLVARKGAINEWHFAHENGQTHINCIVGARNFIRRVAADVLRQSPGLFSIDPHRREVVFGRLHQQVVASDEVGELEILDISLGSNVGVATVVARGVTARERIPFKMHVEVEGERSNLPCEGNAALLLLQVPQLPTAVLRSKESTRQAISLGMTVRWHFLPNSHTVIEQAVRDLQERAAREKVLAERRQRLHSWAEQPALIPRIEPRPISAVPRPAFTTMLQPATGAEPPVWVSIYNTESSLFCHRFKDGSYWVLGPSTSGWLLHPWLWSEPGWDESLPASVGTPHAEFEGYICGHSAVDAMQRVGVLSDGMRNTRDPRQLYQEFAMLRWKE